MSECAGECEQVLDYGAFGERFDFNGAEGVPCFFEEWSDVHQRRA